MDSGHDAKQCSSHAGYPAGQDRVRGGLGRRRVLLNSVSISTLMPEMPRP